MSDKSSIFHAGYSKGYLQMILGKKHKAHKVKRKLERENRKRGKNEITK